MIETRRQLNLEKHLFFTLSTLFIYTIMLISIIKFVSYYDKSIEPLKWLLYSLPFATFSLFIKGANLKHKPKRRLEFLSFIILFTLFVITTVKYHPEISFDNFDFTSTYLHPVFGLFLATISWKIFSQISSGLNLIFLVPHMKLTMGKEFHNWLHNYLQAHSVISKCNQIKKILFTFIIFTFSSVIASTIVTHDFNKIIMLLSAISLVIFHFTTMNLFKYELFINWIIQDIDEKPHFFRRWFLISIVYLSLIGSISFLIMPINISIIKADESIVSVKNFFQTLYNKTRPDYKLRNEEIRRRERKTTKNNKDNFEIKPREIPAKKILRFAFYSIITMLILSILGAIITRKYRYKKIPRYFKIPVYLWKLLKLFLSIFSFMLKMFFFILPKKKPRIHINDNRSQNLRKLFSFEAEKLSEKKKNEIKDIIEMYLSFIERAEERGIFYKTGETPKEYTAKVIITLPKIEEVANNLTSIFYLSRYSQETIEDEKKESAKASLKACLNAMKKIRILEE